MRFDHSGERALIGDGQRGIAAGSGSLHEFLGMGGATEKAVVTQAVKFGVRHRRIILYIYTVLSLGFRITPRLLFCAHSQRRRIGGTFRCGLFRRYSGPQCEFDSSL